MLQAKCTYGGLMMIAIVAPSAYLAVNIKHYRGD